MKEVKSGASIEDLIKTSLDKVKMLMETNTIIGDAVKVSQDTTIIPISKASVGFVVGGGEYSDKSSRRVANHFPMAGGSGCGMSVSPVGFIVLEKGKASFIDVENKSLYQNIMNLLNKIISKIPSGEGKNENKED